MDAGGWVLSDCVGSRKSIFFRMRVPIFPICLLLCLRSSNAQAANARSGQVTHVMLFWLERPGNFDGQNILLRALRTLRRFRGVNDVRLGRPLPVNQPESEQSFDLGVVVIFCDREALEKFDHDPRRRRALDTIFEPLVRRYTVYNFANE
jgi:Stress responsive A/B Barrel Domain